MSQVAKGFSKDELFSQPARIIPWFTLIEILHKSKSHKERLFLEITAGAYLFYEQRLKIANKMEHL